jgi:hypothetical protein
MERRAPSTLSAWCAPQDFMSILRTTVKAAVAG